MESVHYAGKFAEFWPEPFLCALLLLHEERDLKRILQRDRDTKTASVDIRCLIELVIGLTDCRVWHQFDGIDLSCTGPGPQRAVFTQKEQI